MLTRDEILRIQKLKSAAERKSQKRFVMEGSKIIRECIQLHPHLIECIIISTETVLEFETGAVPCYYLPPHHFNKLSNLQSPPGYLAVCNFFNAVNSSDVIPSYLLYLDGVRDPGNFGTLLRLADWFGHTELLASENSCDVYNPKVIQASMGAFLRVKVRYEPLSKVISEYPQHTCIGADLNGKNVFSVPLPKTGIIVLGNESQGISLEHQPFIQQRIHIPSLKTNGSESLNVAMAGSVILTELHRNELRKINLS